MNTRPKPSTQQTQPAHYPIRHLSPEEIANPHLVFEKLFTNTHLPALREALWHWLKLTITGTYNLETPLDQANLVYLYEEMERVVEAVWVMREENA